MTQREAEIIALKLVGGECDSIVSALNSNDYTDKDLEKIIGKVDSICQKLVDKANKLELK